MGVAVLIAHLDPWAVGPQEQDRASVAVLTTALDHRTNLGFHRLNVKSLQSRMDPRMNPDKPSSAGHAVGPCRSPPPPLGKQKLSQAQALPNFPGPVVGWFGELLPADSPAEP